MGSLEVLVTILAFFENREQRCRNINRRVRTSNQADQQGNGEFA